MKLERQNKAAIIGSGLGGLSSAIRLAAAGYEVTVFEKNTYAGGKLSELKLGLFRFDKGPSLLTLPHLIEELGQIGKNPSRFEVQKLKTLTHYFYEDGTHLKASEDIEKFGLELHQVLGEEKTALKTYLKKSKLYYETTAELFLFQSLSKWQNFLNFKTLKGIFLSPFLGLTSSMNQLNKRAFKNPKTVQLFNRYATYNGSNPYKAPGILNLIPHLEFNLGAYLPLQGMHHITRYLLDTAIKAGVKIQYNCMVNKIETDGNYVKGLFVNERFYSADVIVSDVDIHAVYATLLSKHGLPKRLLNQQKSSSAFVFYWGIKKEFKELDLHNILFSNNYAEEFTHLFESDTPYNDPTVYINITSKYCKQDAPEACENWFVMVNVPHNKTGKVIRYAEQLRKQVIEKINRILKTNIESYICEEAVLDPKGIELQTSSVGGSLYGNASNNRFSAFLRHANYSSSIKGLYFAGGSVHPGGGIPLSLLSGKIVADLIKENENN